MIAFKLCAIFALLSLAPVSARNSPKEVFRTSASDLNLAIILHRCENFTTQWQSSRLTLIADTAIWIAERLNFLEFSALKFGVSIFETCHLRDDFSTIFHRYEEQFKNRNFLLGVVSDRGRDIVSSAPLMRFCDLLDVELRSVYKSNRFLIKAAVSVIRALDWGQVEVLVPNQLVLREVFEEAKRKKLCIPDFLIFDKNSVIPTSNTSTNLAIFGYHSQLEGLIQNLKKSEQNLLIVPLDGSVLNDLPLNSYIISPPYYVKPKTTLKSANFFPSPQFFEITIPITNLAQDLQEFLIETCNETSNSTKNKSSTINCLLENTKIFKDGVREVSNNPLQVLEFLKIEPLVDTFMYNVFKSENFTYTMVYQYSIFSENISSLMSNEVVSIDDDNRTYDKMECKNFALQNDNFIFFKEGIRFRTSESWIFAFLSLSLLGILLCIAILIFLLTSLCRKEILEGNPVLTILLLLVIIFMYCSIIPLSLDAGKSLKEELCISRTFTITLTFAAAFSLILSRGILLASASKEVGILSHISGSVQSFLCLFIFGVQAALSLQVINHCTDIYLGFSFVYLLSYNAMLLLLLLCLAPLIFKSQRNYREGKYYSIATILISFLWCIWIPAYAVLDNDYKEPIIAFGVFSTASVLLGVIFIPRTYLMTIASTRNQISSNSLPSTSALDIYRAGTQPIYDSINVEAINTLAITRSGFNMQQPDLYSFPTMPEDENHFENNLQLESPIADDKVTRF